MKDNSRLVYSTETGRIKGAKEAKVKDKTDKNQGLSTDGVVRIQRETKGRKGKGVTIISGLALDEKSLKETAKKLKQLCGTGGTIKNGQIEIQGDQRALIAKFLEEQGHKVKLSGG